MKVLARLWADEAGFIVSAELVLVATILVIGMIVGLVSLRNQVVQELVDVGQAVGSMTQSYAYAGTTKPCIANTSGSFYYDKIDVCQDPWQTGGNEPGGISVRVWPEGACEEPKGREWY